MTPTLAGALAKTTALVTGASSGIGAATAKALAAEGAAVALVARRADRLADLRADIESAGGTALAVTADVTDAEQVSAAVQRAVFRQSLGQFAADHPGRASDENVHGASNLRQLVSRGREHLVDLELARRKALREGIARQRFQHMAVLSDAVAPIIFTHRGAQAVIFGDAPG